MVESNRDVVANGTKLLSMGGGSDTAYYENSGTSMSTAVVTGTVACLVQKFRQMFGGADPSPATMKGILIHTAIDGGSTPGPDYRFGWGLVDGRAAADFIHNQGEIGNQIEISAYSDTRMDYNVEYIGSGPIKVTLSWSDPAAVPSYEDDPNLVNDLDLYVFGPDGRHYPWTLDPSSPALPAQQYQENHLDNVEQVFIESPESGPYTIWIDGQVNLGEYQKYTLCITGLRSVEEPAHVIHVEVSSPLDHAIVSGIFPIKTFLIDSLGVSKLTLKIDGEIFDDSTTEGIDGNIIFDPPSKESRQSAAWDTTLLKNGIHTIEVIAESVTGDVYSKNYSVFVYNDIDDIELIPDGAVEFDRITSSKDEDWFIIRISESGVYRIETFSIWDLDAPQIRILLYTSDEREIPIAINRNTGDDGLSNITQLLEADRTYYLRIYGQSKSTGFYSVRIRKSLEQVSPPIIPLVVNGEEISSEIMGNTVPHIYSFKSTVFGTYKICIESPNANQDNIPSVTLHDTDYKEIVFGPIHSDTPITYTFPEDTLYLLEVSGVDSGIPPYSIRIETESDGLYGSLQVFAPEQTGIFETCGYGEHWYLIEPGISPGITLIEVYGEAMDPQKGLHVTLFRQEYPNSELDSAMPRSELPSPIQILTCLEYKQSYLLRIDSLNWVGRYTVSVRSVSAGDFIHVTRSLSSTTYVPGEPIDATLSLSLDIECDLEIEYVGEWVYNGWKVRNLDETDSEWDYPIVCWLGPPKGTTEFHYQLLPLEKAKGNYAAYNCLMSYALGFYGGTLIPTGDMFVTPRNQELEGFSLVRSFSSKTFRIGEPIFTTLTFTESEMSVQRLVECVSSRLGDRKCQS